jgi:hypothetical protein
VKNFLLTFFRNTIVEIIISYLNNPEVKKTLVYKVNMRIDLPGLNEEEEQKFLEATINESYNQIKLLMKGI